MGDSQERTMPKVELQEQHRWLQRFVGDWTFEGEASMGPGQPPETFTGSESVRSLGGLWVLSEGTCPGPDGSPGTTLMTLDTVGPDFADPQKMAKYQDIYEPASGDHRVLTSRAMGEDGAWHTFMTAHYRRKT